MIEIERIDDLILGIENMIWDLPTAEHKAAYACAREIERIAKEAGPQVGDLAIALVGLRRERVMVGGEKGTSFLIDKGDDMCGCGHRRSTHDPCCVSACGCDEFVPQKK